MAVRAGCAAPVAAQARVRHRPVAGWQVAAAGLAAALSLVLAGCNVHAVDVSSSITSCEQTSDTGAGPGAVVRYHNSGRDLANVYISVGLYEHGVEIASGNDNADVPAGQTAEDDIDDATWPPDYDGGAVTCRVVEFDQQKNP